MKSKMLAMFLLAGSSLFARPHFVVGVGVGGYYRPYGGYYAAPVVPAAPVYPGYVAPAPAPYVAPYGVAPFAGAIWIGPRWAGGRYFAGHWGRR